MMILALAGMLLCCCMVSASAGGGYYYINYIAEDPTPSPSPFSSSPDDEDGPSSSSVSGMSGLKYIKKGGQSLAVKSSKCDSSSVGMMDTRENSRHVWNVSQVPGTDYYYISSKNRQDKACDKRYLTSNSSCNTGLYLAKSGLADRQYFSFNSSGDGYVVQNINCKNKSLPSYLSASAQNKGDVKLQTRADMVFSLKDGSS